MKGGGTGGWEKASVVQDTEVAGHYFVFQHGAGRNIDPIAVVGDDDDGALGRRGREVMSSSLLEEEEA